MQEKSRLKETTRPASSGFSLSSHSSNTNNTSSPSYIHECICCRHDFRSWQIEHGREFVNVPYMFFPDGFGDLHELISGWLMINYLDFDIPSEHAHSKILNAQDLMGYLSSFQFYSL